MVVIVRLTFTSHDFQIHSEPVGVWRNVADTNALVRIILQMTNFTN